MKSFCIKRGTKRAALAGLTVAALGVPRPAAADGSLADQSMATQLFKEGRALLDQGRVAPACRKLEESQRLGPGGGTLLNLALCHQKEGRTATAWVEFTEALGIARRDERQPRIDFARAHLAELEPLLSRLSIQVPAAADLPNLEIKRDGGVVGRAAWGSAIPVDPGDHLIEAAAPGKMHWKQSVVVGANAESKVVVMPALEDAPVQDTVELATPEPQSAVGTRPEPREPREPMADRPSRPMPASPGTTVPAWISLESASRRPAPARISRPSLSRKSATPIATAQTTLARPMAHARTAKPSGMPITRPSASGSGSPASASVRSSSPPAPEALPTRPKPRRASLVQAGSRLRRAT